MRVDTAVPGVDTTALTRREPVGKERGGAGGREERRPERLEEQMAVPAGPPVAAAAAGVGAAGQLHTFLVILWKIGVSLPEALQK